jgi:alcohol dehydrogenase (cytochrome c)
MRSLRPAAAGLALTAVLAGGCSARRPAAAPAPGAPPAADWLTYGHDLWGERYAPVAELSPATVPALQPAFRYALGPAGTPQEDVPLEADGVLYAVATGDRVLALDATSGSPLWHYDPGALHPPSWAPTFSRGVALGPDLVYLLTADDRLIALDRGTGRAVFSASVADPAAAYFESMAPLVVGGRVIVGSAGGDEGARGFVAAYDAQTGARLWQLFTVPPRGQGWMAADGFHGGGVVWTTPAYDPAANLLLVGTGNPSPDYFGETRPGPDPYTDSVLGVDAASGQIVWAQQEVAHDLWDYDAASPPLVFPIGASLGVGEAGKDGLWYEWSAASGQPLVPPVAFVKEDHAPPTAAGTEEWPGPDGGANYGPSAYDPALHLAFVCGVNGPETLYAGPTQHADNTPDLGTGQAAAAGAPWTGTITAIDVRSGKIAWQVQTPTPPIGGATVTSGGVVLVGQESGALQALDAQTGRLLWSDQADAPIGAAPIVYRTGGRVYVAVVTGGAGSLQGLFPSRAPGELQVFRLP